MRCLSAPAFVVLLSLCLPVHGVSAADPPLANAVPHGGPACIGYGFGRLRIHPLPRPHSPQAIPKAMRRKLWLQRERDDQQVRQFMRDHGILPLEGGAPM